jgi:hypothetical protein
VHARKADLEVRFRGGLAAGGERLIGVELGQGLGDLHQPAVIGLRLARPVVGYARELGDREVHLHARAVASVGAHRADEVLRQLMVRVEEAQEGALGVGVRDHDA